MTPMVAKSTYGKAALSLQGKTFRRPPLTEVVDDLAGLGADSDAVSYLQVKYGLMVEVDDLPERAASWVTDGLAVVFMHAMAPATQGRIAAGPAVHLSRVSYSSDGTATVEQGDLPALGAWALAELVRQDLVAPTCAKCERPFLSIAGKGFDVCNRLYRDPASGQLTAKTCRGHEHARLVGEARIAYRRIYRNIHGQVQRETVPARVLELWKLDFEGTDAQPRTLEEWLNLGQTGNARAADELMYQHRVARLERIRKATP